jgi:hypothetical protein
MYSPDLEADPDDPGSLLPVERYRPEDPYAFRLRLVAQIGVVDDPPPMRSSASMFARQLG